MTDDSPLISPPALHDRLGAPDLRIVDVRWVLGSPGAGWAAYDAGHIPGAMFLDLDTDLAAAEGPGRHPLPTPAAFRDRLERAGIGTGDEVVAYDDAGGTIAARLWWMLDNLGHERARLLDGGLTAWLADGFPTTTELPDPPARGHLALRDAWTNVIDREALTAGLGTYVVLDARAGPRYRGETEPIDPVAGHIPTARNAPADGNFGPEKRLRPPAELAARYEGLGAAGRDAPVVTTCGSGVTACYTSLAMRVAGLPDPILYPGSYSDWSRSGMPIATGDEAGHPPVAEDRRPRQTAG
jgi:thiosulfate/3-mercaptopyruvate sulfurtransferase